MEAASNKELRAIFVSRHVENRDYISLGTNLPIPTAGVLLAHLTHAPDLYLNVLNFFTNLSHVQRFEDLTQIANPAMAKYAENFMSMEEQFYAISRMDLSFASGLQVDMYGNQNLFGIGTDPANMKMRGPGPVGTSTVMATVKKYFIFINEHSPRSLVKKCDQVSAIGWGEGGPDGRAKYGFPGGGPQYVITPRAIFDFDEESKRMRLKYLLPPSTLEEIIENTGFSPVIPEKVEDMPPPTAEELQVLRTRVDTRGILRD
ncbi:MAG: CoA-transferase [Bacillota bacterium]